ncbi:MAG: ATP-binding protein [Hyphomicrobium sp.]
MSDRTTANSLPRTAMQIAVLALVLGGLTLWAINDGFSAPSAIILCLASAAAAFATGWAAQEQRSSGSPGPAAPQPPFGLQSEPIGASLQALIGDLIVPALAIDASSRVLVHNARVRELFAGISAGQPLYQVSRQPGLLEAVQRALELGVTQSGEVFDHTPGGRRLLATVSPLKDGANELMLIQFRDLSEQDRLAQLRSDFIANASHELRTPLASLKGFIETLQGPASGDAPARQRFLAIMEAQAARMARILDDLLSLSRIEMRAHVTPTAEVDVGAIVRAAVQGLEPIAREANITLKLEAPTQDMRVRGDRDELEQVFQNLIENAIKYGKVAGKVEVSVQRLAGSGSGLAGRIAIAVADDGPGIAEVHLPRLTERFYRVDTASSRERGGTGLGLAIVKHILNRHRGELLIASVRGQGSTFTVILDALPGLPPV